MLMDVKATVGEARAALTVIDSWVTPAADAPMPVHYAEDEPFLVLEGNVDERLRSSAAAPRIKILHLPA
jgi:hypothetical protein